MPLEQIWLPSLQVWVKAQVKGSAGAKPNFDVGTELKVAAVAGSAAAGSPVEDVEGPSCPICELLLL